MFYIWSSQEPNESFADMFACCLFRCTMLGVKKLTIKASGMPRWSQRLGTLRWPFGSWHCVQFCSDTSGTGFSGWVFLPVIVLNFWNWIAPLWKWVTFESCCLYVTSAVAMTIWFLCIFCRMPRCRFFRDRLVVLQVSFEINWYWPPIALCFLSSV